MVYFGFRNLFILVCLLYIVGIVRINLAYTALSDQDRNRLGSIIERAAKEVGVEVENGESCPLSDYLNIRRISNLKCLTEVVRTTGYFDGAVVQINRFGGSEIGSIKVIREFLKPNEPFVYVIGKDRKIPLFWTDWTRYVSGYSNSEEDYFAELKGFFASIAPVIIERRRNGNQKSRLDFLANSRVRRRIMGSLIFK